MFCFSAGRHVIYNRLDLQELQQRLATIRYCAQVFSDTTLYHIQTQLPQEKPKCQNCERNLTFLVLFISVLFYNKGPKMI